MEKITRVLHLYYCQQLLNLKWDSEYVYSCHVRRLGLLGLYLSGFFFHFILFTLGIVSVTNIKLFFIIKSSAFQSMHTIRALSVDSLNDGFITRQFCPVGRSVN